MSDGSKLTDMEEANLAYRLPGYMGYIPHHELSVGRKSVGLAERALQTDADYTASAKRRHSHGVQRSSYEHQIGSSTQPSDYIRPPNKDKGEPSGSRSAGSVSSTAHWATTYDTAFGDFDSKTGPPPVRSTGHDFGKQAHTTVLNHSIPNSSYVTDFTSPSIAMANRAPGTLPARTDELTYGTNKNSNRLLGYAGFVPSSKNNQHQMHKSIQTYKNELLTMNFRQNCTGYTGHVPRSAENNRGPRKPTALTSNGFYFMQQN